MKEGQDYPIEWLQYYGRVNGFTPHGIVTRNAGRNVITKLSDPQLSKKPATWRFMCREKSETAEGCSFERYDESPK
ncbi:MAG: hypothetical protein M1335_06315 [Chloroflexi bacterium]|nr:hypothetical protein [Chloroflexota bacterium]